MSYDSFVEELRSTVGKEYIRILGKHLTMRLSEECEYSQEDRLAVLSIAGITQSYVTTSLNNLEVLTGKDKVPSEETVIDGIRVIDSKTLFNDMKAANDYVIQKAVKNNEFDNGLIVAGDAHNAMRHTKIGWDIELRKRECTDILTVRGTKPKNGTSYAHQYMTIQNLKIDADRPSYVVSFDRVLPFDDKTKILEKLLSEAEAKTQQNVELFIGDGDFDDIDTMNMLLQKGTPFIVRADRDPKVERSILKNGWRDYYMEYDYVKGDGKKSVKVNLVMVRVDWLKRKGIKYPLMKDNKIKWMTYFTSRKPEGKQSLEDFCLESAKYYKKRWGIETGYRDIGSFEAQTHSLSDSVRLFFYIQAILLYNLWVQINFKYRNHPDRIKYFRYGITKSFIQFMIQHMIIKKFFKNIFDGPLKNTI